MGSDFGLAILVILLIAAVPLTLLGLQIAVLRRQRTDHDDLSRRLGRIERTVDRMRDLLPKRESAAPDVPPAKAASTPTVEKPLEKPFAMPVEKPVDAIVFSEESKEPSELSPAIPAAAPEAVAVAAAIVVVVAGVAVVVADRCSA